MQAAGILLLLPFLEEAARKVDLGAGPIIIADYGSSQGHNSMAPMRIAIDELRNRSDRQMPVQVIHTDLPSNDFGALFGALEEDNDSYMAGAVNIFPSAIGRSYFQPILPPGSVHLGWNSWTMHWLSGDPINAPDHIFPVFTKKAEVLAALRQRQASDWRRFLECRSCELRAGGRLLTAFGARDASWQWLAGEFWGAAVDMGRDGALSSDELFRLTLPVAPREIDAIRAPFDAHGVFAGLKLEHAEILTARDPAWATFEATGDVEKFARSHANMTRAWSGPTIARLIGERPDKAVLIDKLFDRLTERLTVAPRPHEPSLAVVVLAKL